MIYHVVLYRFEKSIFKSPFQIICCDNCVFFRKILLRCFKTANYFTVNVSSVYALRVCLVSEICVDMYCMLHTISIHFVYFDIFMYSSYFIFINSFIYLFINIF